MKLRLKLLDIVLVLVMFVLVLIGLFKGIIEPYFAYKFAVLHSAEYHKQLDAVMDCHRLQLGKADFDTDRCVKYIFVPDGGVRPAQLEVN